jgi:hypothetical protein
MVTKISQKYVQSLVNPRILAYALILSGAKKMPGNIKKTHLELPHAQFYYFLVPFFISSG